MNETKLQKKLEEKKQQIIENIACIRCGGCVNYILIGQGSAVTELKYEEVDCEKIGIYDQAGRFHIGFKMHSCKKEI